MSPVDVPGGVKIMGQGLTNTPLLSEVTALLFSVFQCQSGLINITADNDANHFTKLLKSLIYDAIKASPMWLLGLFLILFFLLVFLLLSPFELRVNTWSEEYSLRWRGIASARLTGTMKDPLLRVWLLGWRREFHLLDMTGRTEEKKEGKDGKGKKAARKRPQWFTWNMIRRLLRTFRVRRFHLLLDTDDYVMNAFLFPVFYRFSGRNRQLHINFNGRTELAMEVTNRIWSLLWVFINEITKSKFSKP